MVPSKLTIVFDNGKQYTIRIYRAVDNTDEWMANCEDVMGAGGPGKTWTEAMQNCIASIREITSGNIPVPTKQELDLFDVWVETHNVLDDQLQHGVCRVGLDTTAPSLNFEGEVDNEAQGNYHVVDSGRGRRGLECV